MLLEVCTVSRKTPLDGKLEITPASAQRAASLGDAFPLRSGGRAGQARLTMFACSCARAGASGQHAHHFLESDVLRALPPGSGVRVEMDEADGALRVEPIA